MKGCPDFTGCRIIVVGDVILDRYLQGRVERISPEAPVPVVKVVHQHTGLGGAGNVAMNLKGLHCGLVLIGIRGDDADGRQLASLLVQNGIDHQLVTADDRPTTAKTRIVGHRQQLLRLDEESVAAAAPAVRQAIIRRLEACLTEADAVILSDYGKGLFFDGVAEQVIRCCGRRRLPVFVDPKGTLWERYRGAFCVTPNTDEFRAVTAALDLGDRSLESAAADVLRRYALENLLLTRGPAGMSLFRRGRARLDIATDAREVFDVTGAGDTVIAVFAAAAACGCDLAQAADIANRAAGIVVGKAGARPVTEKELLEVMTPPGEVGTGRVLDVPQARARIEKWRARGERLVFTNGCFDILHVGHIHLLHAAARCGDRLLVGLNSDTSVKRLKGDRRPVVPQSERAALLSSIQGVDGVVLFDEETPLRLIRAFKPDVLVKGGDYRPETVVGSDLLPRWGGRVVIVPLIQGLSTTAVIDSIAGAAHEQ